MLTFFKGGEAVCGALVAAREFIHAAVAILAQILFGPDAHDIIGIHEQAKLIGEVQVSFVIGSCGNQDASTRIALDIITDRGPTPPFPVPEIVAFVNDSDTVAAQVRQDRLGLSCFDKRRSPASSSSLGAPKVSCARKSSASRRLRRITAWLLICSSCGRRLYAWRSSSCGNRCMPTRSRHCWPSPPAHRSIRESIVFQPRRLK
jgi:hypothetical protein